jgi:hypothetical protein
VFWNDTNNSINETYDNINEIPSDFSDL